jgi:NifU-like protein
MAVEVSLLKDHFFYPRNTGDAAEPSFVGRAASLKCGGTLRLSIQVDESHNVTQARFRAAGCEVLIASSSILTERIIGKTTAEAAVIGKVTEALIQEWAGREHCAGLACEALLTAIRAYSDSARGEWEGDEALICTCFFVSERTIEREIQASALTTIAEVTQACNAGAGCGSCHQLIQEILDSVDNNFEV